MTSRKTVLRYLRFLALMCFVFSCITLAAASVNAATEKVTVGKSGSTSVTRVDSISLGTVDLSKIPKDQTKYLVTYNLGIQMEQTPKYSYGEIVPTDLKPEGGTFDCIDIVNQGYYKIVYCKVTFDAAYLSAGTYTANIAVPFDHAVNANGGVYKCVKNSSGDGYTLRIPVSITLKGNNPKFPAKVESLSAKAGNGAVEISWSPVEGCSNYSVFRREGKDTAAAKPDLDKYILLANVSTEPVNEWAMESGFSDCMYVDYYAENAKTYSYLVISGDYPTQYSGNPSRSVSAVPKETLRVKPAAPNDFSFNGETAAIGMKWYWDEKGGQRDPAGGNYEPSNLTGDGIVDHFNIYMNGRLVKQVQQQAYLISEYNGNTTYYWETYIRNVQYDVPYTLWVTAVAPDGTESAPSKKDTTWIEEDSDVSIDTYRVLYSSEDVYDDVTGDVIKTYKGLFFEFGSIGTAYYKVWRKTAGSSDSNYKKIEFTTTPEDALVDTGVTKGKSYTYKIVAVASDGQESDPCLITVVADEDDWGQAPGGNPISLVFRTIDGEIAVLKWGAYNKGYYRLYRDEKLLKTWTDPDGELEFSDNPGADGVYDYKMTWTSRKYPDVSVTTNICRFVRDTSDPDPDSFDKAPGKPILTGRVLGYATSNWLRLNWKPSKTGGEADGYIIYRTDGGIYNTDEWEGNLTWNNPKRNEGEPANDRFWCTFGTERQFDIYDFKNDSDGTSGLNPHKIWIVAYNEVGYSEPSDVLEYVSSEDGLLPFDVDSEEPEAPQNIRVWSEWAPSTQWYADPLDIEGKLNVTWSAPVTGGTVDHYVINITSDGGYTAELSKQFGAEQKVSVSIDESSVGDTYTVTVKAVNSKGEKTAEAVSHVASSVPALDVKSGGTTSAELTWAGLLGAEADITSEYQIWKRSDKSAWSKIYTASWDAEKSYTDSGLVPGTTYEYYVVAFDVKGTKYKSAVKSITLSVMDAELAAPKNFSAANSKGDVILSWTPDLSGGLPAYYELEYQTLDRDPEKNYEWSSINLSDSFGPSTGGVITSWDQSSYYDALSYMITQYGGQKLRLRLRACPAQTVDRSSSEPTDYIEFTWPSESQISHDKNPPQPITPEVIEGDGQITLKWNKRTKLDSGEPAATYYQVVKTWDNGRTGVVATFPATKSSYEWVDTDVINGKKYTYELRPCSSYYYRYYSNAWWYHTWCYMHQVTAVPNGKTADQRAVENVSAFADELLADRPATAADITDEYHDKVMELRDNYATLTDYQKRLIGKDKCEEIEDLISFILYHDTEMQYAGDPELLDTLAAIDVLGAYPADITLNDPNYSDFEDAVTAARDAYDALPDEAKILVNNYDRLKAAEARIKQLKKEVADQVKADAIADRMDALVPENISADTLTDELERCIQDIRYDYDAMTKAQKAKVRDSSLENFEAAEEAIAIIGGASHEHKMKQVTAVSPSCAKVGNIAHYKCTKCGKCYLDAAGRQEVDKEDVVIPADGTTHDWGEWYISSDATCIYNGVEVRVCNNDDSHKEIRTFDAYGHKWDAGVVTQEASIDEEGHLTEGIINFTCQRCGISRTARIEISAGACANIADHDWGEEQLVKKATCVEPGETKQVCSKCGAAVKYETKIDPLAHAWGEWNTYTEATCTESGLKTRDCVLCGDHEGAVIEPSGHSWSDAVITKEANCQHTGTEVSTCTVCNATRTEIIPTTEDHIWDQGTVVRRSTKDEPGVRVFICDVCGRDRAEDIPALDPVIKLSASDFTWDKKEKNPELTVLNGDEPMDETQYSVTMPAGRKNIGIYTITVDFHGDYAGTAKSSFRINPKGTSLGKLSRAKKGFGVKWKKQAAKMPKSRITGYQIQYSMDKKFAKGNKTVTVKGYKKTSRKVSKLKKKKKYYVRIRTYMKTGGKTLYSSWSKAKSVKTR